MGPNKRLHTIAAVVIVVLAQFISIGSIDAVQNGQALWLDLITEDAEAATNFYTELFGWEIGPGEGTPRIIRNRGKDIGVMYEINDELPGTPESQWLVGIVTEDVDAAVSAARKAGGTILRPVTEVQGSGKFAVIRDPQGAIVILGRPSRDLGGPREAGFFVWAELWTDDVDGATKFYEAVLGFQRKSIERPGGEYEVFQYEGVTRTGLVPIENKKIRPVWAPYIGVEDIDDIVTRTTELGGRIVLPPRDHPTGPRIALIEDPSRAMIFVVELPKTNEGSER